MSETEINLLKYAILSLSLFVLMLITAGLFILLAIRKEHRKTENSIKEIKSKKIK